MHPTPHICIIRSHFGLHPARLLTLLFPYKPISTHPSLQLLHTPLDPIPTLYLFSGSWAGPHASQAPGVGRTGGSSAYFLEDGVKEGQSLEATHPMGRARTRDGHTCIWFWLCCPCSKRPTPTCSWETGWSPAGGMGNVPNTQQHPVTATCDLNLLKTTLCFSQRMQIQSQLPSPPPNILQITTPRPHKPSALGTAGDSRKQESFPTTSPPPPITRGFGRSGRAEEQVLGSLVSH